MAYSRIKYVWQSGAKQFVYSNIQMLGAGADPEEQQLKVYLNSQLLTYLTDYTINTTTNTITIIGFVANAMAAGDIVAIERDTKKDDRYVDWTNNAGIDESDLDLEGDQLLFIAQEAIDESNTALRKTPSETRWDGENISSINCGPAVEGSGWTTLDQVNNLIAGLDTATVTTTNQWCFDGTGSQVDFYLNGAPSSTTANNLFVSIDGLTLCPCDTDPGEGVPFSQLLERATAALQDGAIAANTVTASTGDTIYTP
jgi:hypothetical protein